MQLHITASDDATRATMIDSLPDELVLEVVNHFACIRSHDTQSIAFKEKKKEKARQRENRERQLVLHALCLSCHRLRSIATPILYASFVSSATIYSFKTLRLFHRTICVSGQSVDPKICLAECLQYVENRLSDHLGNSLLADTNSNADEALLMVPQYFSMLADVVNHAPNLKQLTVVSLETADVSFWKDILPEVSDQTSTTVAIHGLQKLQSLCFQMNTNNSGHVAWFRRISSAMTSIPMLTDFRASGVMTSNAKLPSLGTFERLKRIDITYCVLEFEEISEIWAACNNLRHIACHWAYLNNEAVSPSELLPSLLRHAKTLETLSLDFREVRMSKSPPMLGSLQSFTSLKSLSLCEMALGFSDSVIGVPMQTLDVRLSAILPRSLEKFALLVVADYGCVGGCGRWAGVEAESAHALWDLSNNVRQFLPDLKLIHMEACCDQSDPNLAKAFEEVGVQFEIVKDSTIWGRT
jgi:hypothetical protein